ncbi:MAG: T9SS type A sorting domain-containing protein, partial [Bacteroidetes bacterium]|nr:T9SS type A sorting domain-containing protein [Bacteroidota bacterium]
QIYKIETWNENGGLEGSDELCNSFSVYGLSPGTTLTNGENIISYTVNHPVFTFTDTAKITVYPNPATPAISSAHGSTECQGDTIFLSTGTFAQYQWFNDTTVIVGGNTHLINVVTSGNYHVNITDANGCTASSLPFNVTIHANPPKPTFWRTGNIIQTMLSGFGLQWYLNGVAITTETDQTCNITSTGYYSVLASANGCSTWSDSVLYSPLGNGIEQESGISNIAFFPNPTKGMLNMKANSAKETEVVVEITDILGKTYFREQYLIGSAFSTTIDLSRLSKGIYLLRTSGENLLRTEKIVLQ